MPAVQELSKITMPIAFNEPLSFLQRITEYMEHVHLVHRACRLPQPLERMQVGARPKLRVDETTSDCLVTSRWGPALP